jgi:hypothetical protein
MTVQRRVPMTWGNRRQRVHLPYLLVESDHHGAAASDLARFWQAGFNPAFCMRTRRRESRNGRTLV